MSVYREPEREITTMLFCRPCSITANIQNKASRCLVSGSLSPSACVCACGGGLYMYGYLIFVVVGLSSCCSLSYFFLCIFAYIGTPDKSKRWFKEYIRGIHITYEKYILKVNANADVVKTCIKHPEANLQAIRRSWGTWCTPCGQLTKQQ